MKYHALPMPDISSQQTYKALDEKIRHAAKILHDETVASIKNMNSNKTKICSPDIYYLYDNKSMLNLVGKLCDGDEIIVHGEGQPFVLGLEFPSEYDLHGQSLAKLLHDHKIPDVHINIALLSCQSATTYAPDAEMNINFARDMSKSLKFYDYKNITVTGYTGFVVVKKSGKYSVLSDITDKLTKGMHSSLKDALVTYKDGEVIFKGRIMTNNLSNKEFDWAKTYKANALLGQEIIKTKPSQLKLSFFNANQENVPTELTESISTTPNTGKKTLPMQS